VSDMANPKVFVSYSWDDDTHKEWVAQLATRLRGDGVDVSLDQWHLIPGDQLPEFMERGIRDNDYVLIICTPNYKHKSDKRSGGAGYEGDIMTAEVFSEGNHRKFIPILARDSRRDAFPSWLQGKYSIDLSSTSKFESGYEDLITTILGTRPQAPPIGEKPNLPNQRDTWNNSQQADVDEPVKILGVIVDEVTEPRMDGSRGSALYRIPFRLSRVPSSIWGQLFVKAWDMPPRWTTAHRPGIASVSGDKIILDGTRIEEVEEEHRDTLVLCVNVANEGERAFIAKQKQAEEQRRRKAEEHKSNIEDTSKRLKFD